MVYGHNCRTQSPWGNCISHRTLILLMCDLSSFSLPPSLSLSLSLSDPCKDSQNSLNSACRVEPRTRKPLTYSPPESCAPDPQPLCASDGHTYRSDCEMQRTAMQKGLDLRKIHPGHCRRQGEA